MRTIDVERVSVQLVASSTTASIDKPALIRRGHFMKNRQHYPAQHSARAAVALAIVSLFSALTTVPAQAQYQGEVRVESDDAGWLYDLGAVISIFVDAPLEEVMSRGVV